MLELLKTLAWPACIGIVAICFVVITFRLTSGRNMPKLRVNLPGNFSVSTGDDEPAKTEIVTGPPPGESLSASNESALQLAESTKVAAITESSSGEAPNHTPDPWQFMFAKTGSELDEKFDVFKKGSEFLEDQEFWECHYLILRRRLGIGGTQQDFEALARAHPDWVEPFIQLISDAVGFSDFERGFSYLGEAQKRETAERKDRVIVSALRLHLASGGLESGMTYMRHLDLNGLPDALVSELFITVAEDKFLKSSAFGSTMFREFALRRNPSDQTNRFRLAYSYGEHPSLLRLAYAQYDRLVSADHNFKNALNNMGVILNTIGVTDLASLQIERSEEQGSALSAANLANGLSQAGYTMLARGVLKKYQDSDESKENRASAEERILSLERKREEQLEERAENARSDQKEYNFLVGAALKFWFSPEFSIASGIYVSDDGLMTASINRDKLFASVKMESKMYSGELTRRGLCWEGDISSSGQSILTAEFRKIAFMQSGPVAISGVICPVGDKWDDFVYTPALRRTSPIEIGSSAAESS